jgi:hypothetical protein
MVCTSPFPKINTRNLLGLQPDAPCHLLRREALPPSANPLLRQVDERALWAYQMTNLLKDFSAGRENETGSDARSVVKIFSTPRTPYQVADALMLERMSLALNPRGQTYRAETLMTMAWRFGNAKALDLFRKVMHH